MTAAIFGLLGVIVGGVINGVVTATLQRRNERSDQRSAARLVRSELVGFGSLGLEAAKRSPEQLPQLRNATPVLWQSNRAVLARALSDEHWALVARAYAHVDALLSVLVFEADGTLVDWRSREAQRLLGALIEPATEAAVALRRAAGFPTDQIDETPDHNRDDDFDPKFPERGPVAA